jgi:hypothetical protein
VLSEGCKALLTIPLAGGPVQPLAQDFAWKPVFGAGLDGTLAWTSFATGNGGVMVTDVADGATRRVTGDGKKVYAPIVALDGENVYFSTATGKDWASDGYEGGHVYALPRAGGSAVRLSAVAADVYGIAVGRDVVAWTHAGTPDGSIALWRIMARAK